MLEVNKIYCGDCLELMKEIPDGSIDFFWTDPPYNVGKDYGVYKPIKVEYITDSMHYYKAIY